MISKKIFIYCQNYILRYRKSFSDLFFKTDTLQIRPEYEHRISAGKEMRYVQLKLLYNGPSFPAWFWKKIICYWSLKTQKHSVNRPFLLWFFLFMNILIDNLLMEFFIFKTIRCVWVKRFYTNNLLGFFLSWLRQLLLWKPLTYDYIALKTCYYNYNYYYCY